MRGFPCSRTLAVLAAAATVSLAGDLGLPRIDPTAEARQLPSFPHACPLLPFDPFGKTRTFHVTLLHADGRSLSGRSRICRETPDDAMRVRIGGETIHPEDTRFLVAGGDTGRPNSSDWLFPTLSGRIHAFTVQPRAPKRKIAYLEQDGILDPYTDRLLSRLVREHAQASAYMRRKAWGRYGSWGMAAAGGALFIAAALVPGEDEKDESGPVTRTTYRAKSMCVAAGIGFLLGGGGWRLVTANNHVQAIRAYNADGPEPFHAD